MRRGLLIALIVAVLAGVAFAPASTVLAASGTRILPSSVTAGASFDIDISTFDYGMFGQIVETLPSGFSYVSCDELPEAAVDVDGQVVMFTLLEGDDNFSYTVAASGTAGTYVFSGILKDEDKIEYDVGGSTRITVKTPTRTEGEGSGGARDTIAPTMSKISASSISETTADISWRTNEGSTSQVEYWTSSSELSLLDKTMVYDHLLQLADLTPGTIYYYKTMSVDRADNLAVSDVYTFTTLEEVSLEEASEEVQSSSTAPPPAAQEKLLPPEAPAKGVNWPVGWVIIAAIVLLGLIVFLLVRKKTA